VVSDNAADGGIVEKGPGDITPLQMNQRTNLMARQKIASMSGRYKKRDSKVTSGNVTDAQGRPASPPWRSRIVAHTEMDPAEIKPNPWNWREHPAYQLLSLSGMLEELGWIQSVVVNQTTGHLIDGHARVDLAYKHGEPNIPVIMVELSEEEEKKAIALFDPISALAKANAERFADLLATLQTRNEGLSQFIQDLAARAGEIVLPQGQAGGDPDYIPQPPPEAISKRGQIYALGPHRLMCGDSSSTEDVDALLAGAPIHLVNTDPPYNVRVEPRTKNAISSALHAGKVAGGGKGNVSRQQLVDAADASGMHHLGFDIARGKVNPGGLHHQSFDVARDPSKAQPKGQMRARDRALENDYLTDEAFMEMLKAWFGNMARVLEPGRSFYIWGGYANIFNYAEALRGLGMYFSQAVIWVKQHPVLTRKDFMGNHEWCFYGWKEGAGHYFNPAITNAVDVWEVKKISPPSMVHLTEKPVELASRALLYSSRAGENVLDLFAGSGSTLIACEQAKRRAYLMEIDPLYCDVILKRWHQFSGQEPKLLD